MRAPIPESQQADPVSSSGTGGPGSADEESSEIRTLEDLLDRLRSASRGRDRVSIDLVLKAVGRRSFGSLLLLAGLIALSPLSGIPSVPTTVGVIVLLLTAQLLLGRSEFWLPRFLLRRSIARPHFEKAVDAVRPVTRFVDRLLKPRLSFLTEGFGVHVIAAFCLLVSVVSPFLEVVPFAASGVGAAVSAFGLALISHDGVLALVAFGFCTATLVFLVSAVL